jgi:L-cysteine S-thiosulfotransferase
MRAVQSILVIMGLMAISACVYDPNMRRDFDFPIERGDAAQGELAFIDLGCPQCHSVRGVELPALNNPYPIHLELGGSETYRKTDAELMTSIINPNHVISDRYRNQMLVEGAVPLDSPMPYFEYMSLGQLFDIVAFLDSKYQVVDPLDDD